MKRIIFLLVISVFFFSCKKEADMNLKNNVSNAVLNSINWGEFALGGDLYPGETTEVRVFKGREVDFPETHKITFRMTVNNQEVYLETVEEYTLDEGGYQEIVIDDNTAVVNP